MAAVLSCMSALAGCMGNPRHRKLGEVAHDHTMIVAETGFKLEVLRRAWALRGSAVFPGSIKLSRLQRTNRETLSVWIPHGRVRGQPLLASSDR